LENLEDAPRLNGGVSGNNITGVSIPTLRGEGVIAGLNRDARIRVPKKELDREQRGLGKSQLIVVSGGPKRKMLEKGKDRKPRVVSGSSIKEGGQHEKIKLGRDFQGQERVLGKWSKRTSLRFKRKLWTLDVGKKWGRGKRRRRKLRIHVYTTRQGFKLETQPDRGAQKIERRRSIQRPGNETWFEKEPDIKEKVSILRPWTSPSN